MTEAMVRKKAQRSKRNQHRAVSRARTRAKGEIIHEEQDIQRKLLVLKDTICLEITNAAPLEGVKPIKSSITAVSVKLSTIKHNDLILNPNYYIQKSQAEMVCKELSKAETAKECMKRIQQMCQDKCIKERNMTFHLNPTTLSILKKYF